MKQIKETAYAKINLGLDILGKREDGYHEVSMIMQSVGLSDEVVISKGEVFKIAVAIAVLVHSMPCSFIGEGEVNGAGRIFFVYIRSALVEIAGNAGSICVQVKVNDGGVGCTYVANDYNIVSSTLVDVDNSVGMPSRIRILAVSIDSVKQAVVSIVGTSDAAAGHVENGALFDK